MRRLQRSGSFALALLVLAACQPSVSPAPPADIRLSIEATGLMRCGIIPDWTCSYFVEVTGPDGVGHEGLFDDPDPFAPTRGPTFNLVGDIPETIAPGRYQATFLKQRVSDMVSFVPVPSGTDRATNRGDIFAKCDLAFEASSGSSVTLVVAFEDSSCRATATITR